MRRMSLLRIRIRSWRTVQHTQPLFISKISSFVSTTRPSSTPTSPNSFSMTAMRLPCLAVRMWFTTEERRGDGGGVRTGTWRSKRKSGEPSWGAFGDASVISPSVSLPSAEETGDDSHPGTLSSSVMDYAGAQVSMRAVRDRDDIYPTTWLQNLEIAPQNFRIWRLSVIQTITPARLATPTPFTGRRTCHAHSKKALAPPPRPSCIDRVLTEADLDMELEMEARGGGNHDHRSQGDGNVRGQAEPGRSPRRPGKARVLTEADLDMELEMEARGGRKPRPSQPGRRQRPWSTSNLAGVPGGPARLEC